MNFCPPIAPCVRSDRPEYTYELKYMLKQHSFYVFDEDEVLPLAREIVSLIGLDELESKLQKITDHDYSLDQRPPQPEDSLKNILEQLHKLIRVHIRYWLRVI